MFTKTSTRDLASAFPISGNWLTLPRASRSVWSIDVRWMRARPALRARNAPAYLGPMAVENPKILRPRRPP